MPPFGLPGSVERAMTNKRQVGENDADTGWTAPWGQPAKPRVGPLSRVLSADSVVGLSPEIIDAMKNRQKVPGPAGPLQGPVPPTTPNFTGPLAQAMQGTPAQQSPEFVGPLVQATQAGVGNRPLADQPVSMGAPLIEQPWITKRFNPVTQQWATDDATPFEERLRQLQRFNVDPAIAAANMRDNLPSLFAGRGGRQMAAAMGEDAAKQNVGPGDVLRMMVEERAFEQQKQMEDVRHRQRMELDRQRTEPDPIRTVGALFDIEKSVREGIISPALGAMMKTMLNVPTLRQPSVGESVATSLPAPAGGSADEVRKAIDKPGYLIANLLAAKVTPEFAAENKEKFRQLLGKNAEGGYRWPPPETAVERDRFLEEQALARALGFGVTQLTEKEWAEERRKSAASAIGNIGKGRWH